MIRYLGHWYTFFFPSLLSLLLVLDVCIRERVKMEPFADKSPTVLMIPVLRQIPSSVNEILLSGILARL